VFVVTVTKLGMVIINGDGWLMLAHWGDGTGKALVNGMMKFGRGWVILESWGRQ